MDQNWKRTEYNTWDEAFRGLVPAARQQSVRVAAYTQVLFVQACTLPFGTCSSEAKKVMQGQYADLAYKCGMYHQLGKALVPPEYQIWQQDFTEEEIAVYRKYTSDGRLLVATLQDRGNRAKEKRKGTLIEQLTENIPWRMIRESCEQHMERWDGSGYPMGRKENLISPIAQIVGIAKELDRLASETKSEKPFDEAFKALVSQSGTLWSTELIEVLIKAKAKCRDVYRKYIRYTMTLPETIPLVQKKADRPMGLKYRPMVAVQDGPPVAYEAIPWFGGIANRPGETEGAEDLEQMLIRTELVADISFYFLYEAADTLLRMQNCKLETRGVVMQMIPAFYTLPSQLQRLNQLLQDQPISKEQLILTVPFDFVKQTTRANIEIIRRYLRNGFVLLLDGFRPEDMPVEELLELGFTYLRLDPAVCLQQQTANAVNTLRQRGLKFLGGGADNHDLWGWLIATGVEFSSGTLTGLLVNEDEIIRDGLLRER